MLITSYFFCLFVFGSSSFVVHCNGGRLFLLGVYRCRCLCYCYINVLLWLPSYRIVISYVSLNSRSSSFIFIINNDFLHGILIIGCDGIGTIHHIHHCHHRYLYRQPRHQRHQNHYQITITKR